MQGILNKIINMFLIRNFGSQKAVDQYIERAKRIKLSTQDFMYLEKIKDHFYYFVKCFFF